MTPYHDMEREELVAAEQDWTGRCLEWADDLANAIEQGDYVRAAMWVTAYRQARMQLRKVKYAKQVEAA